MQGSLPRPGLELGWRGGAGKKWSQWKTGQGPSLEGGQRPSLIYLACKWMSINICSVPYEEIVKGLESSQFTGKGIQTTLKQMKRYAALIIIKEMQNKTRAIFTHQIGKDHNICWEHGVTRLWVVGCAPPWRGCVAALRAENVCALWYGHSASRNSFSALRIARMQKRGVPGCLQQRCLS